MLRSTPVRGLMAIVVAAAFVLLGSSAAHAQDYNGGSDITFGIEDVTLVAGQTVGVSGTGCGADEDVSFTIGSANVGSATTDGDGNYDGSVTVPSLASGDYTVNADCGGDVLGLTITVGGSGGGGSVAGSTSGSGLARTGTDLAPLAGAGAASLVLGAAAVYGTRRRRNAA